MRHRGVEHGKRDLAQRERRRERPRQAGKALRHGKQQHKARHEPEIAEPRCDDTNDCDRALIEEILMERHGERYRARSGNQRKHVSQRGIEPARVLGDGHAHDGADQYSDQPENPRVRPCAQPGRGQKEPRRMAHELAPKNSPRDSESGERSRNERRRRRFPDVHYSDMYSSVTAASGLLRPSSVTERTLS